jgi:radical SAM protein with 4Fe4S-binding SPASM domain
MEKRKNEMSLDGCFNIWKTKIQQLTEEHPLQIISWEATRKCNLKCSHCGSPAEEAILGNELSTQEVIDVFEVISKTFDMSQFKHINITGGEPFVRKDLLTILQHLSQYSFYRNIDIQTNGIYIANNPEVLDKLIEFGVTGIGISIDGLRDEHDNFRKIAGGFEKSVEAAKLAIGKGLVVTMSVVVHSKNIHQLEELYLFAEKIVKPRVFRLMFIDPIGRTREDSEYLLTKKQKLEVINFLQKKYELHCENYFNKNTMMVELGCGGWFGKELEGTFRPFIFHCIAGINNLGILFDGKISSCSNIHRFFIEGDVRTNNIKDVWEKGFQRFRNREWRKTGKCANCRDWDFCHGGPMHLVDNNFCIL